MLSFNQLISLEGFAAFPYSLINALLIPGKGWAMSSHLTGGPVQLRCYCKFAGRGDKGAI